MLLHKFYSFYTFFLYLVQRLYINESQMIVGKPQKLQRSIISIPLSMVQILTIRYCPYVIPVSDTKEDRNPFFITICVPSVWLRNETYYYMV